MADEVQKMWARRVELAEQVGHFVSCKSLAFNREPGDTTPDCTCDADRLTPEPSEQPTEG